MAERGFTTSSVASTSSSVAQPRIQVTTASVAGAHARTRTRTFRWFPGLAPPPRPRPRPRPRGASAEEGVEGHGARPRPPRRPPPPSPYSLIPPRSTPGSRPWRSELRAPRRVGMVGGWVRSRGHGHGWAVRTMVWLDTITRTRIGLCERWNGSGSGSECEVPRAQIAGETARRVMQYARVPVGR